jgi:superfamily I DNA and RNA helicase
MKGDTINNYFLKGDNPMQQQSHFFSNIQTTGDLDNFLQKLEGYANEKNTPIYLIDGPLGDKKYTYELDQPMILLIPEHQIMLIDTQDDSDAFDDFIDDFSEDLGHLSDKFEYKKVLGRPRVWKQDLITDKHLRHFDGDIENFITENTLTDPMERRQIELLISLLIGSINSVDKIGKDLPETVLDKVKRNITLFDSDQTRFIFKKLPKKRITIQGLAGTGKTELLLHKLKELYTENTDNRIAFTCYNKSLANSLSNRIPEFFDFMKVEEQIKWGERLWVMHSWGSQTDRSNIGLYSSICKYYDIPFQGLSSGSFDQACLKAISNLKARGVITPMFDYILIDESQDFQESFFALCELVTKSTVYVAGDIFQNIFQSNTTDAQPDFLLNKCYRTDPKTLMFAHSLGFGLFERPAIRWLSDEQWNACGYNIEHINGSQYTLSRNPLRKFVDLEESSVKSVDLVEVEQLDTSNKVIEIIEEIKRDHPTVVAEDIAIIFTDDGRSSYDLMNLIAVKISSHLGLKSNKIYDTKSVKKDHISISNINNIKGLEFPFIICLANSTIGKRVRKRNSLYMTLTRSFITSYLVVNKSTNASILPEVKAGLQSINTNSKLIIVKPTSDELIDQSELVLDVNDITLSQKDIVDAIFEECKIPVHHQEQLRKTVHSLHPDSVDKVLIKRIIDRNQELL